MTNSVLIADDDAVIRTLITDFLTAHKMSVQGVDSGNSCLEFLSNNPHPDVILLDYQMPGKNGAEVLEELQNDPVLCKIPVIVLSANEDTKAHFAQKGVEPNNFLVKPFDLNTLLSLVKEYAYD